MIGCIRMYTHSSLSSVDPPQVWFDLKLPSHVVEEVQLSSLQLEAVVYACQQHMNILSDGSRAGFLIGVCVYMYMYVHEFSCGVGEKHMYILACVYVH